MRGWLIIFLLAHQLPAMDNTSSIPTPPTYLPPKQTRLHFPHPEQVLCNKLNPTGETIITRVSDKLFFCKLHHSKESIECTLFPSQGPYIYVEESQLEEKQNYMSLFVKGIESLNYLFSNAIDHFSKKIISNKKLSSIHSHLMCDVSALRSKIDLKEEEKRTLIRKLASNESLDEQLLFCNEDLEKEYHRLLQLEVTYRLAQITSLKKESEDIIRKRAQKFTSWATQKIQEGNE